MEQFNYNKTMHNDCVISEMVASLHESSNNVLTIEEMSLVNWFIHTLYIVAD